MNRTELKLCSSPPFSPSSLAKETWRDMEVETFFLKIFCEQFVINLGLGSDGSNSPFAFSCFSCKHDENRYWHFSRLVTSYQTRPFGSIACTTFKCIAAATQTRFATNVTRIHSAKSGGHFRPPMSVSLHLHICIFIQVASFFVSQEHVVRNCSARNEMHA